MRAPFFISLKPNREEKLCLPDRSSISAASATLALDFEIVIAVHVIVPERPASVHRTCVVSVLETFVSDAPLVSDVSLDVEFVVAVESLLSVVPERQQTIGRAREFSHPSSLLFIPYLFHQFFPQIFDDKYKVSFLGMCFRYLRELVRCGSICRAARDHVTQVLIQLQREGKTDR